MNENLLHEDVSAYFDGELALEAVAPDTRASIAFAETLNTCRFLRETVAELPILEPTSELKERLFKKMGATTVTTIPAKKSAVRTTDKPLVWRIAAAIVLGVAMFAAYSLFNGASRETVARVASLTGAVKIVESPEKEKPAAVDDGIASGDRILTAPGASVEMAFTSGVRATLMSDSALSVKAIEKARLDYGSARIETVESTFTVETRHGGIETAKGSVEIDTSDDETRVKCLSGKVRVRDGGEDFTLDAGESRSIGGAARTSRVEKRTPPAFSPPPDNTAANGHTGALTGTLTGPDGKPVSGASLELFKYTPFNDEYRIMAGPKLLDRTTTNSDGYYAFGQLPADAYRIVVKSKEHAPDEIANVVIDEGEIAGGVDWKLKPALQVLIRTIDETGQPVPDVPVTAWSVRESDFMFFVQEDLVTDEQGECRLNLAADMKGEAHAFPNDHVFADTKITPNSATAELVLRKGRSIRGTAVDDTGAPMSGATVLAQEITSTYQNSIKTRCMRKTTTDDEGVFHLNNLPDGKIYVLVQAEGYEPGESQPVEVAGADVDGIALTLTPGAAVHGQVVDASGLGVEGAIVVAEPDPMYQEGAPTPRHSTDMRFGDEVPAVIVRSGRNGMFNFPPMRKHALRLGAMDVESADMRSAHRVVDSVTGPITLKLEPVFAREFSSAIKGTVLTAEGRPAFPAHVSVRVSDRQDDTGPSSTSRTLADQKGRFTLMMRRGQSDFGHGTVSLESSGLPQSESKTLYHKVIARTPEGLTGSMEYQAPADTAKDGLVIQLSEGGVIAGMVRDSSGFPVAGATVIARPTPNDHASDRIYKSLDTKTDEQGRFRIRGLEASKQYTVASSKIRHGMGYLSPVGTGVSDVLISLPQAAVVRGKILDPEGKPLANAAVNAAANGYMQDQTVWDVLYDLSDRAVISNRKGEFELFIKTFKGRVEWSICSNECRNVDVTALPGAIVEGVVLHKSAGASIAGRVIDGDTKQPIAKAVVLRGMNDNRCETNDKGEFLMTGLPPGTVQLRAQADGYASTVRNGYWAQEIKGGEEIKDFVIELVREGVIEGIVIDTENNPIEDASLHVWEDYGSVAVVTSKTRGNRSSFGPENSGRTGSDGKFTIHGIPRSYKNRIMVSHMNYTRQDSSSQLEVTAPSEPGADPLRIVMVRTARISGTVKDLDGNTVDMGRVRILRLADQQEDVWTTGANIANGHFTAEMLPGRYLVETDVAGYAATRTTEFDLAEGELRNCDLRMRPLIDGEDNYITFRFDMGNNRPNPNVTTEVALIGKGRHGRVHQTIYVMESDIGRTHQIKVDDPEIKSATLVVHFHELPRVTVENIPIPSRDLVIKAVASGHITGRVVDADTGAPIAKFAAVLTYAGLYSDYSETQQFGGGDLDFNKNVGNMIATMHIHAPGYVSREFKDIRCQAEATLSLGEIKLTRGVLLKGTVVDGNGKPVENARLSHTNLGAAPDWLSAKTDGQGRFELGGFTAGIARITVAHAEFATQWNAKVVIEPGKAIQETQIVMTKGGSIEGIVYDADGKPFPGVNIYGSGADSVQTDSDGKFRKDLIPPGKATIWASTMSNDDYRSFELDITDGQLVQIEIHPGQDGTKEIGRTELNK